MTAPRTGRACQDVSKPAAPPTPRPCAPCRKLSLASRRRVRHKEGEALTGRTRGGVEAGEACGEASQNVAPARERATRRSRAHTAHTQIRGAQQRPQSAQQPLLALTLAPAAGDEPVAARSGDNGRRLNARRRRGERRLYGDRHRGGSQTDRRRRRGTAEGQTVVWRVVTRGAVRR